MDLIRVENLRKSYGGAFALRGASFTLRAGETHALMGENGAGKSTLIKILAGATLADSGEIHLHGAPARPASPAEAHRLGLRFIHQELNIVPALSVAENIFLGRPYPRRFGLVNWRLLNARARQALAALEVAHISPRATLASLPVGDRMLVKIAAAFLDDHDDEDATRRQLGILAAAQRHHETIIACLKRGEGARVEALMREHCHLAIENITLFKGGLDVAVRRTLAL